MQHVHTHAHPAHPWAHPVAHMWGKEVVRRPLLPKPLASHGLARDPLEAVVVRKLGDLHRRAMLSTLVLVVILQEVAVDVAKVDKFDVWGIGTKVKGGDLDGSDEGWTCCAGKLAVNEVNESRGQG